MVHLTLAFLALPQESSGSIRGHVSAIQPTAQLSAIRKPPPDFSDRLNASFELGTPIMPENKSSPVDRGAMPPWSTMMSSDGLTRLMRHAYASSWGGKGQIQVAVVGSSGNMLCRGLGKFIDDADLVVRINGAPSQANSGYANDVGTQHDICVANGVGLYSARKVGMLSAPTMAAIAYSDSGAIDQVLAAHVEWGVFNREWIEYVRTTILGTAEYPSGGFLGICMAIALTVHLGGAPVLVTGMGACLPCNKYYDCNGSNGTAYGEGPAYEASGRDGGHPFGTEALVRRQWYSANLINLKEQSCTGFPHYTAESAVAEQERPGSYVEDVFPSAEAAEAAEEGSGSDAP
jgi:hypothetical protein